MSSDNIFYTYAYLDPRKPGNYVYGDLVFTHEPFYVGKGAGGRYRSHLSENVNNTCNRYKYNKIKAIHNELKCTPIILKVKENLSEIESLQFEIFLIKLIGRADLKVGPLTNMTDGGEGSTGAKQTEEQIRKARESKMGSKHYLNKMTIEERKLWFAKNGKRGSEHFRFGTKLTNKTKKRMSESQKKRNSLIKKPVIVMNIWFESIYEAMNFFNLTYNQLYDRMRFKFPGYRQLYTSTNKSVNK